VIFAAALAAGLLLHWAFPARFMPLSFAARLGAAMPALAASAALALWAYRAMRHNRTPVDPYKPTARIVDEGPFSFTRNPLYLSLFLLYGGIAVLANALWCLVLAPAVFIVIERGVVMREEKYLERKFGGEYVGYKKRVRRWL
jgi:protein-S-isoprenylcysteine O-methyltransferase Ste14